MFKLYMHRADYDGTANYQVLEITYPQQIILKKKNYVIYFVILHTSI